MEIKLTENANILIDILTKSGFQAYAVGGYVRDSIMKRKPYDLDITTNATVEEMLELFSDFRCLTQGAKHGTVAVVIGSEIVECTTYRIDGDYADGRHPNKVLFSANLSDDLSRRDFTVNAMAYNNDDGLIDLFGGLDDIDNKTIRAIGDPDKRFTEDALRIMRALRFSATLGFTIEKSTAESMKKNAEKLSLISNERITQEFEKLIIGENIKYVFENFDDILNKIIDIKDFDEEIINSVENCPKEVDIRLFALLQKNTAPLKTLDSSRLIIKKVYKQSISQMIQMFPPKNRIMLKLMMSRFETENIRKYLEFLNDRKHIEEMRNIIENKECFSLSQLKINGKALEKLGFHGKEIQKVKQEILNEIINERLENDEGEIVKYLGSR